MNHVGTVADAERLPWLSDDRPKRSSRGPSLAALGVIAAVLVAGASYWLGMQTAPVDESTAAAPSTTIDLPEPMVGKPEVIPAEPAVEDAKPQRQSIPEAQPQRAAPTIERRTPAQAKRRVTARKPAAAAAAAPKKTAPEFWPVREVEGAAGRMVRIGTFATPRQAKKGWWKVVGTYPGMKRIQTLVVPVQSLRNGQTYYRLQMGTTSHAHSEVLCQRMRVVGQSCVVIGLPAAKTGA
jgi:hypothetical protein